VLTDSRIGTLANGATQQRSVTTLRRNGAGGRGSKGTSHPPAHPTARVRGAAGYWQNGESAVVNSRRRGQIETIAAARAEAVPRAR
jgi:hypothetical protein